MEAESNIDNSEKADVDDAVDSKGNMDQESNIIDGKEAEIDDDVDENSSYGDGYYGGSENVSSKAIDLTGDLSRGVRDRTAGRRNTINDTDSGFSPAPSKRHEAEVANPNTEIGAQMEDSCQRSHF